MGPGHKCSVLVATKREERHLNSTLLTRSNLNLGEEKRGHRMENNAAKNRHLMNPDRGCRAESLAPLSGLKFSDTSSEAAGPRGTSVQYFLYLLSLI